VLLGLDGLGNLIKEELLRSTSSFQCFDYQISSSNNCNSFVHWHFGNNVERSVNMETEVLVETLGGLSWSILINVDNFPSLIQSTSFVPYANVGTFLIFASGNFNNFVVLDIDEVFSLISKKLPPSTACAP